METKSQKAQTPKARDRAERRKQARSRFRFSRSSPLFKLFAVLGPGLIAANAGNDAGGIATFATAGASYGYNLLWALAIAGFCLAIVQEMCARMGAITGKGLADLIREKFRDGHAGVGDQERQHSKGGPAHSKLFANQVGQSFAGDGSHASTH